ncbi:hypothetical protein IMZ48_09825 [Candidatus Bathyarchaeota archaeon]|nr:hypothetical protein [Candidatus Bathyarchaeota archaeon]
MVEIPAVSVYHHLYTPIRNRQAGSALAAFRHRQNEESPRRSYFSDIITSYSTPLSSNFAL